ncbi:hypothetical protein QTP88_003680 [Uroleucon formosanum]
MPNYCCVREIHTITKNIFKVPQNEDMKKKWEEALGFTIKKSYHICATHFEDSDIISKCESGQECNKYTICLKRLYLKKKMYAQSLESIKVCELNKACTSSLDSTLDSAKNKQRFLPIGHSLSGERHTLKLLVPLKALAVKRFLIRTLHGQKIVIVYKSRYGVEIEQFPNRSETGAKRRFIVKT